VSLFADQSREQLRAAYRDAWRKWQQREVLQPLEAQLADVIREHPEYQALLASDASLADSFAPEQVNPFLHLGLHLALREQLATDRPAGIAAIHRRLCAELGSAHEAEHRMIEPLAETLWEAQRAGRPPQEGAYLQRLWRL